MITVIDYGAGNLRSVENALKHLQAPYRITSQAADVCTASAILLPGVGHFGQMMRSLELLGLIPVLRQMLRQGTPYLGICLGMHALYERSEEAPSLPGLGILRGSIQRFPAGMKVPHMGWNQLQIAPTSRLFRGISADPFVYFAHSYYLPAQEGSASEKKKFTEAALADYGITFIAAVEKNNIYGVQFHPEKSGEIGLRILENFVRSNLEPPRSRKREEPEVWQAIQTDVQSPPSKTTKAFVDWLLHKLTPKQEKILKERFGLWIGISKTLQEVGEQFAISRERIRQIQDRGLNKLRQSLHPSLLDEFIRTKLHRRLDSQSEACGVLNVLEAVEALADDCSPPEAELAAFFLTALRDTSDIFSSCLSELERGVYSLDPKVSDEYAGLLDSTKQVLEEQQKPVTEDKLWEAVNARLTASRGSLKKPLFTRMLAISPSFARLRDQRIVLSYRPDDLASLAEQALRDLGKPAHFTEIAKKIVALRPGLGPVNKRTVHNVLGSKKEKFVLTSPGTYGLREWGIERPPIVKDRLVQLLSDSPTPLPYEYLKQKVLEVCNCKENSVRMTLDLNPQQLFRKYQNDRYGLRKHDGKDQQAKEAQEVRELRKKERLKRKAQGDWNALGEMAKQIAEHPDATPEQRERAKKILALLAEELSGEK